MRISRPSHVLPFGIIAMLCIVAVSTKVLMLADLAFFSDENASKGVTIQANKDNIVICIGSGTFPIADSALASDSTTQYWIYQYTGKEPPFDGKYFLSDGQKATGATMPANGTPLTEMEKGFIYYIHSDRDLHFRCGDGLSATPLQPANAANDGNTSNGKTCTTMLDCGPLPDCADNPVSGSHCIMPWSCVNGTCVANSGSNSSASQASSQQASGDGSCMPIDCAAPMFGCRYVNPQTDANGCPLSCGTLTCSNGSASSMNNHAAAPSLAIASLAPSSGPTGTRVIVNGTGFEPTGNSIHFSDSTFDNLDSPDGTHLLFTVPDHNVQPCQHATPPCETNVHLYPAGQYPVTVQVGNDTSNSVIFTITPAASSSSFGNDQTSSASSTAFGASCTSDNDCPIPLCTQSTYGPSFCGQKLKCVNGACQVDSHSAASSSSASVMSCTNGQTAVASLANATLNAQLPTHTDQIAFADFDKDGKTDIVYRVTGSVTVLHNTGNGFQQAYGQDLANGTNSNIAVGDVNNDGYPDIVAATTNFSGDMGSIGLTVLLNDKNGGFQYPISLNLPSSSHFVTSTNLAIDNGDILATLGSNPLSGKLSRIHVNHFTSVITRDITVSDFSIGYFQNTAGSQWTYAGLYNQTAKVLFQLVPETTANDVDLWVAGQNLGPVLGGPSIYTGLGKEAWMSVGDINGDGMTDIAIATYNTSPGGSDQYGNEGSITYWMQNNGYGNPWTIHIIGKDDKRTGIAIGDVDGNGTPDIVTTGWPSTFYAQGETSCKSIPSSTDFDLAGSAAGSPSSASSAATSTLTITSLSPASGPQGTSITITGTGFAPTGNVVHINGTTMTVGSADGTHITANNTYTNGTGIVPIYVTIGNTTSNAVNFTVTANTSSQSSAPPPPAPISIEQTGFHLIKNGAYTDTTFKVTNTGTGTFETTFFNAGTQIGMDEQISAAAVNGQIVDCSTVPYTTSFKSVELTSCYGSGSTGIGSLAAGQSMQIDIERQYTNYCSNNVPQQGWFAFYAYYVYPGHYFGKTASLTSQGCAGTPSPDDGTSPFRAQISSSSSVVTGASLSQSSDTQTQSSASSIFFGYDPVHSAPTCIAIDCPQPMINCHYINATHDANGCPTSCGQLSCSNSSVTGIGSTQFTVSANGPKQKWFPENGGGTIGSWNITASQAATLGTVSFTVDANSMNINYSKGVLMQGCQNVRQDGFNTIKADCNIALKAGVPLTLSLYATSMYVWMPRNGSTPNTPGSSLDAQGLPIPPDAGTLTVSLDTQNTTWTDMTGPNRTGLNLTTALYPSTTNWMEHTLQTGQTTDSPFSHVFDLLASLFSVKNLTAMLLW